MTETPKPTPGVDPSTLRNVPEGLFDTRVEAAGTAATPATAFTRPYADAVDAPVPGAPAAASPPVADAPYVAAWADADAPATSLPPTSAAEQATFAPDAASAALGAEAPRSTGSLLRRWGAPAALVAAGLVGGMAVTAAVTSASASTPAPTSVQRDAGRPGDGTGSTADGRGGVLPGLSGSDDAVGSGSDDADDSDGLTIDELTPDAIGGYDGDHDGDGDHGRGGPGGGYSLSDGFSLRDGSGAPPTQGGTGASR
jgi:hypothetical protein